MDTAEKKIIELDSALYREKQGVLYKYILETVERPLIEQTLEQTEGNQLEAARILGINRNTIRSKIKKLGINVARWKII
jgi:two-component system nitrogen regulation response regulator GlnG